MRAFIDKSSEYGPLIGKEKISAKILTKPARSWGSSANYSAVIVTPARTRSAIIDEMNHVDIDSDR